LRVSPDTTACIHCYTVIPPAGRQPQFRLFTHYAWIVEPKLSSIYMTVCVRTLSECLYSILYTNIRVYTSYIYTIQISHHHHHIYIYIDQSHGFLITMSIGNIMIIYVFSFFGVPHFYTNPFRICSSLSPSFPRCESSRVLARITAHEGWGCLHCCSSRSTKGNPESVLRDVKHCVYIHLFAFIYIYIHLVYIYIIFIYTYMCNYTD
jgi:hypothetical protein